MRFASAASAAVLALGAVALAPSPSSAALVDFSGGGVSGQRIASGSTTIGGILVEGFYNAGLNAAPALVRRAAPEDRGIGVCSAEDTAGLCGGKTWSGDTDEIDNVSSQETLRLTPQNGLKFTGVFALSSLDNNQGTTNEKGYLSWNGGTVTFDRSGATVVSGATSATLSSWPLYPGEGNTFLLTIVSASLLNAPNVTFFAGCLQGSCGTNNDYLVAGAAVVPLPAALPMFLSALAGLGLIGRRAA